MCYPRKHKHQPNDDSRRNFTVHVSPDARYMREWAVNWQSRNTAGQVVYYTAADRLTKASFSKSSTVGPMAPIRRRKPKVRRDEYYDRSDRGSINPSPWSLLPEALGDDAPV